MLIAGKNAIVTGAHRGIGRATVELFAENGANVWTCLRNKDESFEKDMAAVADRYGVWIKPVYFDLASESQIKEAVGDIAREKIAVDILVNNAGTVGENRLFQMTSAEDMKRVFEINFFGAMTVTRYVSRLMTRHKNGAIVNIASVAGIDGDPAQLEYSASKAALICATKKLARELGVFNIRVNAVAPGLTDTAMLERMDEKTEKQAAGRAVIERRADPREIANVVLFLASDMASFITAQTLRADGGII